MANQVAKVSLVAIADIEEVTGIADASLAELSGLEFTGVADAQTLIGSPAISDGSDASLGFTSGIDSTYEVYEFHFINMHPENGNAQFMFQVNDSGDEGGAYDESEITSTTWNWYNGASKTATGPNYEDDKDLSNDADYQPILSRRTGAEDSESVSGILTLFHPSSNTFVKHFISQGIGYHHEDYALTFRVAGYINDTTPITQINFKFDNGQIQGGQIRMYGLAKS